MKLKSIFTLLCIIAISAITLSAQEMTEEEKEKMMQDVMALAQPGPEHKLLATLEGEWTMDGKTWMQPGDEPLVFKGTSTSKMVLGGRFLETVATSVMFDMETAQIGYIGFDRRTKKFNTIGMDTWGTYWVTASGDYDAKSKKLTMYGEDEDPVSGFVKKYDFIWTFTGVDDFQFELFFYNPEYTGGAESHKMVDITYTRVK